MPRRAWSAKRERHYDHIKGQFRERGHSADGSGTSTDDISMTKAELKRAIGR